MVEQDQQVQLQAHLLQEQVAEVAADIIKQQVEQVVQVVADKEVVQATNQEQVQQIQAVEAALVSTFLVLPQVLVEQVEPE
jgi:hypothetical protein